MSKSVYRSALLLLLLPCAARAEVEIAPDCRVKNEPPGRCGWCALETLARHHRLTALYGLTRKHPSTCSARSLEESLATAGVPYRIQYPGGRRRDILRYAIREGLGAVIGFRKPHPGADGHIVTLVDFTEAGVKVIDSNDADGRTRTMSRDRFLDRWDGFALVPDPGSCWARATGAGPTLCRAGAAHRAPGEWLVDPARHDPCDEEGRRRKGNRKESPAYPMPSSA
jgi:hypothetical protein